MRVINNSQEQTRISSSERKNTFYRQFINKSSEEQRKLVPVILSKILDLEIKGELEVFSDDLSEIEFLNKFRGVGALFKNSNKHLTRTAEKIIEFIRDNHSDLMGELLIDYKADKSVSKSVIIESMVSDINNIRYETKLKHNSSISTNCSSMHGNSIISSVIEEQDAISEDNVENYLQGMMEADARGSKINCFDRTNSDKLLDACKSNVKILERIIHSSKEVRDYFFSVTKYDNETVEKIITEYFKLCVEPSSEDIEFYLVCLDRVFESYNFQSNFSKFIFSKLKFFFPKIDVATRKKLLKFGFHLQDNDPIKHYFITARNSHPLYKMLNNKIRKLQMELTLLYKLSDEEDIVRQLIIKRLKNMRVIDTLSSTEMPDEKILDSSISIYMEELQQQNDTIERLILKIRKYSIDTTEELMNLLQQRAYLLENKISEYRS